MFFEYVYKSMIIALTSSVTPEHVSEVIHTLKIYQGNIKFDCAHNKNYFLPINKETLRVVSNCSISCPCAWEHKIETKLIWFGKKKGTTSFGQKFGIYRIFQSIQTEKKN